MGDLRQAASVAVQTAIIDALSEIGIVIFGVRPQEQDGGADGTYPHIHVQDPILGEWDTNSEFGHEVTQRIHVRGRGDSSVPVKIVQGQIYERLHNGALALDGWSLILMQQETAFVDRLPDRTFDAISEFRLLIEQT